MNASRRGPLRGDARMPAVLATGRAPPERALQVRGDRRGPPRAPKGLKKSDLENKLLITRTSGRNFGSIGEAWVDVSRLWVACFDVVERRLPIATRVCGGVYLQALREVGDVVLIHADKDYRPDVEMGRQGLTTLTGLRVMSDSGVVLGKVRDFLFDPSSGRIMEIIFDSLGLPFLPTEFLDRYAVDVQDIRAIRLNEGAIYLRGASNWRKVGNGKFQYIVDLLPGQGADPQGWQGFEMETMEDQVSGELQTEYRQLLEESRRQQEAYYAAYGQQPMNRGGARPGPGPSPSPPPQWAQQQQEYAGRASGRAVGQAPGPSGRAPGSAAPPRGPQPGAQGRPGRKIDEWLVKDERMAEARQVEVQMEAGGPQGYQEEGGELNRRS
eukprot:evm.model.scf_828EXC.3 EVM.evm.TU.scf_828EXC.3   scf_828EXC:26211-27359(+)